MQREEGREGKGVVRDVPAEREARGKREGAGKEKRPVPRPRAERREPRARKEKDHPLPACRPDEAEHLRIDRLRKAAAERRRTGEEARRPRKGGKPREPDDPGSQCPRPLPTGDPEGHVQRQSRRGETRRLDAERRREDQQGQHADGPPTPR
ncbi:MAG: hypothetical protein HXY25_11900 [Alphaproteobacteria bacterium]|nr:hypothetical protein [Alphaproteobacteria bacterium]